MRIFIYLNHLSDQVREMVVISSLCQIFELDCEGLGGDVAVRNMLIRTSIMISDYRQVYGG